MNRTRNAAISHHWVLSAPVIPGVRRLSLIMDSEGLNNSTRPLSQRLPVLLIILGSVALILFVPYKSTVVPEWKIRVIDENGQPVVSARVAQSWHHYSYDIYGGGDQYADENGYVAFPERTFRANLLYRILRSSLAVLLTLAHGSTGIEATVQAITPERVSEIIEYEPGKPLAREIILQR